MIELFRMHEHHISSFFIKYNSDIQYTIRHSYWISFVFTLFRCYPIKETTVYCLANSDVLWKLENSNVLAEGSYLEK